MKGFLISLLLFALLLGGILLNGKYLRHTEEALSAALEHCAAASVEDRDAETALDQLSALWQRHSKRISFTVPPSRTEEIDGALRAAKEALKKGDAFSLNTEYERLSELFANLLRYEIPSVGSIL